MLYGKYPEFEEAFMTLEEKLRTPIADRTRELKRAVWS
jgi:hypothetical protein